MKSLIHYSILIAFIVLFLENTVSQAQNVNIPDNAFKYTLVTDYNINTNFDKEIQVSEAVAFKGDIQAGNVNISDMTGLEAFVNITRLICSSNRITNLDLRTNASLKYLECEYNNLTELDVTHNLALQTLRCKENSIDKLDVSNNKSLKLLDCSYNFIKVLNFSENSALAHLQCSFNNIRNLDLSVNASLGYLECTYNFLMDLDVTHNLALQTLHCDNNFLKKLDLSANKSLKDLHCHYNEITSLNVTANTSLLYLECGVNMLSNLNLSANRNLIYLHCGFNQLTELDISGMASLEDLYCNKNALTTLDLSSCISIKSLSCEYNQLNNLNAISLKTGIWYFRATNNPLLTCIQVNNEAYANATWSDAIDSWARFSEVCIVGTEVNLSQAEIVVFPNPNNGIFTISGLPAEEITIEVYSMAGEKVYSVAGRETSHRVDISGCTKGIYIVNISNGKNVFTHKAEIR